MNKSMNLQDVFLNQARREKIAVTIFLTNGFQFKGTVKGLILTWSSWILTGSRIWSINTQFLPSFL